MKEQTSIVNRDLILITGGAGFIGSAFARLVAHKTKILVLDLMTYAGDSKRLSQLNSEQFTLIKAIRAPIC